MNMFKLIQTNPVNNQIFEKNFFKKINNVTLLQA